jgi:hypothetical protein
LPSFGSSVVPMRLDFRRLVLQKTKAVFMKMHQALWYNSSLFFGTLLGFSIGLRPSERAAWFFYKELIHGNE